MLLDAILNFITSSTRTAAASLSGAIIGQITREASTLGDINTAFQHAAWTTAIMMGLLTIINLFFPLRSFYETRKRKKQALRKPEDNLD